MATKISFFEGYNDVSFESEKFILLTETLQTATIALSCCE